MPKFSIITPVNLWRQERVDQFLRCIESVKAQTFRDFEWVIIDDGSNQPFLWENLLLDAGISSVNIVHKEHEERVIAYNRAFEVAKGEWWLFLDSDDELVPDALEIISNRIDKSRGGNHMFNFGAIYRPEGGTETRRPPFKPRWLGKKYGHEVFGGGNIVNGTFVFSRSIWEDLGGFPPAIMKDIDCTEINYPEFKGAPKPYIRDLNMNTPYSFSAAAQLEFPELRQFYMVNHVDEPEKILKELGNPWGQDMYLFYKYTRKYHSIPFEEYLYIVRPKP